MESNTKKPLFFYGEVNREYKGKKMIRRASVAGIVDKSNPDKPVIRFGMAECSIRDRFTRAKGRAIALARAEGKPENMVPLQEDMTLAAQFTSFAKKLIAE